MRFLSFLFCGFVLVTFSCSREEPAAEPVSTIFQKEVAVIGVPDLDEKVEKKLMGSLSDLEGVISAKVDGEKKELSVAFQKNRVAPDKILSRLSSVHSGVSLIRVEQADGEAPSPSKCEGCPSRGSCGKSESP